MYDRDILQPFFEDPNKFMSSPRIEHSAALTDIKYTGCHRRNGPNFGRVFLMLNYTNITQNTYVPS